MEALMNAVAFVFQDTHIFAESVYNNIAMHRKVHREDVEKAAKAARCHDFILSFPNGYDTKLGDGGHKLSGGEAQRLMLARAVCSRPDMLLVDEPTAQLDTRTAHSVSHVLGNLAGQGMIVLVATHDPDTRDACGRVIDLADYAPGDNEDSGFAPAGGNEPAEPTDPAPAGGGSREADGGGPTDSTDIAENGSEVRS